MHLCPGSTDKYGARASLVFLQITSDLCINVDMDVGISASTWVLLGAAPVVTLSPGVVVELS